MKISLENCRRFVEWNASVKALLPGHHTFPGYFSERIDLTRSQLQSLDYRSLIAFPLSRDPQKNSQKFSRSQEKPPIDGQQSQPSIVSLDEKALLFDKPAPWLFFAGRTPDKNRRR